MTRVTVQTTLGDFVIVLRDDLAPNTAGYFRNLADSGFYDDTLFHRAVPGFLVEGGDPGTRTTLATTVRHRPDFAIEQEFGAFSHRRGTVSMVKGTASDVDTKFFVVTADSQFLDRQYPAFGYVEVGMDVLDRISALERNASDRPLTDVRILRMFSDRAPYHITIEMPEIEGSRQEGLYGHYQLPVDARTRKDGSKGPLTLVEISATRRGYGGNSSPVPDGTTIYVGYQGRPENSGRANFLTLDESPIGQTATVTTTAGKAQLLFETSTGAQRWRLNSGQIEVINPDVFTITASSTPDDQNPARSFDVTVAAGRPEKIEIIRNPSEIGVALEQIDGPEGQPLAIGRPVAVMRGVPVNYSTPQGSGTVRLGSVPVKLGGINPDQTIVGGQALWLLVKVSDRYDNPIVRLNYDESKMHYWLVGSTIHFPANVVPGYFLTVDLEWKDYPDRKVFFARRRDFLPYGIADALYVPSILSPGHTEDISLDVYFMEDNGQKSTHILEKRLRITTAPDPNTEKWRKWFFEGEVEDLPTFVSEIALSLVPIIGDGRDILIYGWKYITDRELNTYDHIIVSLSTIGLALDVTNIASAGTTTPADAIAGFLKAIFKLMKRYVPKVPQVVRVFERMIDNALSSGTVSALERLLARLKSFAEKVWRLLEEPEKLRKFLALISVVVTSFQLLSVLFELFEKLTVEEIMDLLWYAAFSDGKIGENDEVILPQ